MSNFIDRYALSDLDKKMILDGSRLKDSHIDKFQDMLQKCSKFRPQTPLYIQKIMSNPNYVIPTVHPSERHIQIVHSCNGFCPECVGGHWICCYYDTKAIFIYDSMNLKSLNMQQLKFLQKLFPFFNNVPIYFPKVQYQANVSDCGVFAIAFATSLYLEKNPSKIVYNTNSARVHLYNMFQSNKISHFPIKCNGNINAMSNQKYIPKVSLLKASVNESWNITGLPNPDNVSCYANASIQSIFHCTSVRQKIIESNSNDTLKIIFKQYVNHSNVDIRSLRAFDDKEFVDRKQQDVAEFITHLCNKSSVLQLTINHELQITRKCSVCNIERPSPPTVNYILPLALPQQSDMFTLQNVIDYNISYWNDIKI